ncbi:MAG TPA: RNA 2',3'-cyclic phosphodiesterase [Gaiellaceae bacterium]|nr:RNA 2',3'-cyclic phosphodiesterase [Gaiellaceae bacterium]
MTDAASVESDVRIRLFCALRLPDETVDALVEWQTLLPDGPFRPVAPDNLHVTLAFLGHRPRGDVEPIAAALEAAAQAARQVRLSACGYRETRSVGMLVLDDAEGAAAALAADLHARLERLSVYEPERRPWLPHVTVVRFRERPRLDPPLPEVGQVVPSGAAVYHSVLRPTGAQYVALQEFGVGRPEVKERTERGS